MVKICFTVFCLHISINYNLYFEPSLEKTNNLEILILTRKGFALTKMLISCAVTAQLICAFVFAHALLVLLCDDWFLFFFSQRGSQSQVVRKITGTTSVTVLSQSRGLMMASNMSRQLEM